MENGFEIINRNLVFATLTNVFRIVRRHIHFGATVTEGQAGKEISDFFGRWFPRATLIAQDGCTLIPKRYVHDGFHLGVDPFAFRLEGPVFRTVTGLGVVGTVQKVGFPNDVFLYRVIDFFEQVLDGAAKENLAGYEETSIGPSFGTFYSRYMIATAAAQKGC